MSEIPVRLSFSGDRTEDAQVPTPVVAGTYQMLKLRMSEVMRGGTASELRVEIHADPANIRVTLSDDGVIDDPNDVNSRQAIELLDLTMEKLKSVERDQLGDS